MIRLLAIAALAALGGCGLGETAVSSAGAGHSDVQQVQQAKATETQVRRQLDDAAQSAAAQRQAAETGAQ